MIRVAAPNLAAEVDKERRTWRKRAAAYTLKLKAHGAFTDQKLGTASAPNWSHIKPAFMRAQDNKCAYCERALEGAHELDVEHFRPKSKVSAWPGPPVPPSNGSVGGYWWLAYDIENYCVACKPCNSGLKLDHFPIAGAVGATDADIATLNVTEQPLLLFPLGASDVDPESLIGWSGTSPVPLAAAGTSEHQRAATTIAFFDLGGREMLHRQRATEMLVLWLFLQVEGDPLKSATERADATTIINRHLASPKKPMRACLKAFAALARADRAAVLLLVEQLQLLASQP